MVAKSVRYEKLLLGSAMQLMIKTFSVCISQPVQLDCLRLQS